MATANNQNINRRTENSNEIRKLVVKKIIEYGEPISKVVSDLHLKRTTVNSIIQVYRRTGRILKSVVRGKPRQKITDDVGLFIELLLETHPTITLFNIKNLIHTRFDLHVSIPVIRKYLYILKITLKRCSLVLDRVNDPERIELRQLFATEFLTGVSLNDVNNIFIDESGFNLHMRRNYGRSLSGSRVSETVPAVKGVETLRYWRL